MSTDRGDTPPPPPPPSKGEKTKHFSDTFVGNSRSTEDPRKKETLDNVRKSIPPRKEDGPTA